MFDYSTFTPDQIEERINALKSEISTADEARLSEINGELEAIEARRNELIEIEARKVEERKKVAEDLTLPIIEEMPQEERKMVDIKEFRNSKEYVNAFAEYIKTNDDTELRTLLSTNVEGGTIAVPDFVADEIKTAWDNEMLMAKVPTIAISGNYEVMFEISGTDAVIHVEGSGAVAEEELVEGIAKIEPISIKKWISISKTVMKLTGEAFLNYIYRELAHKIAKKAADTLVAKIAALPQVATATTPSAAKIELAPDVNTVGEAISYLSDEANNPVVIMNKRTKPAFIAAAKAAGYALDPFDNCEVIYNNSLPAFSAATAGEVYMIVGDLNGAVKTTPDGDSVDYIFDELSRKKENLVEVLGEQLMGLGVVADKSFTLVAKPQANG
ncbi:MAG: phage major capsid protein [Paludibacteraceae bacterium]|nr:phage major capsid protein [Paludibacteraceae bacterium]